MSPQAEDVYRPARPRSNTSTFPPFNWRRDRREAAATPTASTSTQPSLPLEALIEALTPPAVPSLSHARALSSALSAKASNPRLAILSPILGSLCSDSQPLSLQAAGYDILAAYWENSGSAVLTTGDRLSCLSLFLQPAVLWSPEVWEERFKALVAIIHSGAETIGMEGDLLRVLRSWIEGAFEGLTRAEAPSVEERHERQRSVETLAAFLTALVGKPEFVSRLSEADTEGVLRLWGTLIDQALLVPLDYISPPSSPLNESRSPKPASPSRFPHRRHHSSASHPSLLSLKHPAEIVVDAYLTYLSTRLLALAPTHLRSILPLLFRSLAFYASPLPRISLTLSSPHQHSLEKRIADTMKILISGPYSSSCTRLLKHYMFPSQELTLASVQASVGALKTLRISVREMLFARLARAFITQAAVDEYTPAGVPSRIDLERNFLEHAWPKDDAASWDLIKARSLLCRAVKAWVEKEPAEPSKEAVLSEVAGILKDVIQTLDQRSSDEEVDDEEVSAVGDVMRELVVYLHSLKTRAGGPVVLSLAQTDDVSPFLASVTILLAQDLTISPLYSVLPTIILSIAEHIPDAETASLLDTMSERQSLTPTSPLWLEHWRSILMIPGLYTAARPQTRPVAMKALQQVWEFVKDIPVYRRPLAELVFDFWKTQTKAEMEDVAVPEIWNVLGDEAVLRQAEAHEEPDVEERGAPGQIIDFLHTIATERHEDNDDTASIRTTDMPSTISPQFPAVSTATASPVMSRMQSDYQGKDRESAIPSVMSILSSFTSGNSPRSQSQSRQPADSAPLVESPPTQSSELPATPKTVGAVAALISIFSQLTFTPLVLTESNTELAVRVFRILVSLLSEADCIRARLAVLQFLMRLRVDRDHRLYYASADYDKDGHISTLAALVSRSQASPGSGVQSTSDHDLRSARPRIPQERNGRRPSRGRGGQPARIESRSRSRTTPLLVPTPSSSQRLKPRDPIWSLPEVLPFSLIDCDTASEGITSYDPTSPKQGKVLPFSQYLTKLVDIIEGEKEWEILSYVLCHLPTQLANKHLFCGPKSRVVLGRMLTTLCSGISKGSLATAIEHWPDNIIAKDAHGLAYHSLTVLISYKRCFLEIQSQHHLVEAFLLGLNGQPSTIKCCLHALSLCAFELQPSTTKFLSSILEKLSQIMSNPAMAVHIIDFLAIIGSHRGLHANFTESDYKMVFAVALQYLQHHNHPGDSVNVSWALSQYLKIMSYYIVYLWFLAVELPDRPRHIKFIARQLELANEGKGEKVDEPAEVCFDWLARYTYASADPRPANSMLSDIVMKSASQQSQPEPALCEKTWITGNAVITVRALQRRGWLEIVTRRASGLTKFLCRSENVPMVPLGDVDPDLVSVAACPTLDRGMQSRPVLVPPGEEVSLKRESLGDSLVSAGDAEDSLQRPDPITGYVWSGSAPSQRRKDVSIDPAYFAIQLSSYPETLPEHLQPVKDTHRLASFCRSLDRMPVIDTHKVGIMYVAPGQFDESEILRNSHGSPAYTRFLEGLARLINLRGQVDVYAGGLDPDEDGEYAYAWWDDIGQILYHTATLMPSSIDEQCTNKKRHIGNDFVRIVWNDSGKPYKFDTLTTQFQFVNIIIEPHSRGSIAAYSNNLHENEYFKVVVQRAPGMIDFTPIGDFKLISAENLPLLVRQLSLLTDWFVSVFQYTESDTLQVEMQTNWRARLRAIKKFRDQIAASAQTMDREQATSQGPGEGVRGQTYSDFTTLYL